MSTDKLNHTMTQKAVHTRELSVAGAFGPLARARIHRAAQCGTTVVVNFHGSFGHMEGSGGKYRLFAEVLSGQAGVHVALFETSRLPGDFPEIPDPFLKRVAAFRGKTYAQELEDARRLLRTVVDGSLELFGVRGQELGIALCGNSLGGFLCIALAAEFPQVKWIAGAGVGIREMRPSDSHNNLAATLPERASVEALAAGFRGAVLGAHGTLDDVFSREDFARYMGAFSAASARGACVYGGGDHSLSLAHGRPSPEPYTRFARSLLRMLETGLPPSEEVELMACLESQPEPRA